ncbi:MAG TPA: putative peptide modification system cyclase [Xanthomonadaceae bacterium]|nr:putative peptide modification system cyclase [Xanthomonadaceae bacterium]
MDASGSRPRLRTLLLTDLCDSTGVVERLGDVAAAALFRAHDVLVMRLLQRWEGRLIDRSDGLLLLFVRPVDGLGFALAYVRGLRELGREHGTVLQARAGLHVGEVLTWSNSDDAVHAGAKPLEVEGLAKPLAARLMSVALPGQILLSSTAEPPARRAARELGADAPELLWRSHGHWRFKGVPEPLELHEVGEPGLAPMRTPRSGAKAWRDVPAWRRPAAVASAMLVLCCLGVGAWFATRSPPALAFAERDWVVIGDLDNRTGDPRYDDALEGALRVAMEQSRFVNVVSRARIRDGLAMMQRDPATTPIDRTVGAELAQRVGARVLLLPAARVHDGRVRLSIQAVDPVTGLSMFTESASGTRGSDVVDVVEDVGAAVRLRLGESLVDVHGDAGSLEQVTTSSLDALRAYGLGEEALNRGELGEAEAHFRQALALDPGFALAHAGIGRIQLGRDDIASAMAWMRHALSLRDRITPREALYLEAHLAMHGWEAGFPEQWRALADLYPDMAVAAHNTALIAWAANDFPMMARYAARASVPQSTTRNVSTMLQAIAALGQGRLGHAAELARQSEAMGYTAYGYGTVLVDGAARRHAEAGVVLRTAVDPMPHQDVVATLLALVLEVDQGHLDTLQDELAAVHALPDHGVLPLAARATALEAARLSGEPHPSLRPGLRAAADALRAAMPGAMGADREILAIGSLLVARTAALDGDLPLARAARADAQPLVETAPRAPLPNLAAIVDARIALAQDDPALALRLLSPWSRDGTALYLTHAALADALLAAGDPASAIEEYRWLADHRGRAYAEWGGHALWTPANVAEATLALLSGAETALSNGDRATARLMMARFNAAWPVSTRQERIARRAARVESRIAPVPHSISGPALAP